MKRWRFKQSSSGFSLVANEMRVMTPVEEKDVFARMGTGDPRAREKARETAIVCNLPLVLSIAVAMKGAVGLDMDQRVSAGILGLIHAVDRFDPTRGFKFSTYATYAIRNAIRRAMAREAYTIQVPDWTLCERHNLSGEVREKFLRAARPAMRMYLETGKLYPLLLDLPAKPKTSEPTGEQREAERRRIRGMMQQLSERERMVIEWRFGVDCRAKLTLQEVGQMIGCTRERVRQIEKTALEKMRAHATAPRRDGF